MVYNNSVGGVRRWMCLITIAAGLSSMGQSNAQADGGRRDGQSKHPAEFTIVENEDVTAGPDVSFAEEQAVDAATLLGLQAGRRSVLVYLTPNMDRHALRVFVADCGAELRHEYTVVPDMCNIRDITTRDIAELRRMPGVVSVEEDGVVEAHLNSSVAHINGLQTQINSASVFADGEGVRVCVIDTGIDSDHAMFADRIDFAAGRDFVNNDNDPEDNNGHGTHVSGIILGGVNHLNTCGGSAFFQGVAPAATLIGVKTMNWLGSGTISDIIAGIDYCADQSPTGGRADVINMSLGTLQLSFLACDSDPLAMASNNAVDAGVVVVASAGNSASSFEIASPACGSKVIAVGATFKDFYPNCDDPQGTFAWSICTEVNPWRDKVACFSNRGVSLDVVAPGCSIVSASSTPGGAGVRRLCGTSMSAPHVTGLAALIVGATPHLSPAGVRSVIQRGATDLGPHGFDKDYGHGLINVVNSLKLAYGACTTDAQCSDGIDCTDDFCWIGFCRHTANDAICVGDGLFCSGPEVCDLGDGCVGSGDPCPAGTFCNEAVDFCDECRVGADCDDGVSCTDGACANGICVYTENNFLCADDGLFCNGVEFCDMVADCVSTGNPCPVTHDCNEQIDACTFCMSDADCDDGNLCTDDSCNNGHCFNGANTLPCDDGLFCTPTSVCTNGACVGSGIQCPARTCDELADVCGPVTGVGVYFSRNSDFSTDDNNFTRDETIYMLGWSDKLDFNNLRKRSWKFLEQAGGQGKKIAGKFTNQFDGTYTASLAATDLPTLFTNWLFIANLHDLVGTYNLSWVDFIMVLPQCTIDSECIDGVFCNGAEFCSRDQVCLPGVDPCPGETCNEQAGMCVVATCADGVCDASEDACNCPADCGVSPLAETDCADGVDDDCDGLIDCDDADCSAVAACNCAPKKGFCSAHADCCSGTCRLDRNECR